MPEVVVDDEVPDPELLGRPRDDRERDVRRERAQEVIGEDIRAVPEHLGALRPGRKRLRAHRLAATDAEPERTRGHSRANHARNAPRAASARSDRSCSPTWAIDAMGT